MTKGDNNAVDDTGLFPIGQPLVDRDEIIGVVKGFVPCLGWIAIALQTYRSVQLGGASLLLAIAQLS